MDEAAKAAKMAWLGAHLVPDRASYHASISAGMFWGRALLTKGASLNETAASAGQAAAAAALDFGLAISQVAKCAALAAGALAAEASFAAAKPPDVVATTAAAHAIAAAESQGMNRKAPVSSTSHHKPQECYMGGCRRSRSFSCRCCCSCRHAGQGYGTCTHVSTTSSQLPKHAFQQSAFTVPVISSRRDNALGCFGSCQGTCIPHSFSGGSIVAHVQSQAITGSAQRIPCQCHCRANHPTQLHSLPVRLGLASTGERVGARA